MQRNHSDTVFESYMKIKSASSNKFRDFNMTSERWLDFSFAKKSGSEESSFNRECDFTGQSDASFIASESFSIMRIKPRICDSCPSDLRSKMSHNRALKQWSWVEMVLECLLVGVQDPSRSQQRWGNGAFAKMGEVSGNAVRIRFVPSKDKHF